MLGHGYNASGNVVYINDTWDYSAHTMAWGGSYSGLQHYVVTVLRLNAVQASAAPTVTNASGATGVTATTATLNGNLTSNGGADTTVHIYWGDNDGGTGIWDTDVSLVALPVGAFSTSITSLTTGMTYYYRSYATNSVGTAWASSTSSFVAQNTNKAAGSRRLGQWH